MQLRKLGKSVTGNFSVTGTGGFGGLLTLSATSNQLKLSGATLSYGSTTARTLTIPTVSGASSFVMTTENQTIGGVKNFFKSTQSIGRYIKYNIGTSNRNNI